MTKRMVCGFHSVNMTQHGYNKTIKNFLLLVVGVVLLPFAICVCLCSLPFIVYIRLIELFKVRGIEADDLWFINK